MSALPSIQLASIAGHHQKSNYSVFNFLFYEILIFKCIIYDLYLMKSKLL